MYDVLLIKTTGEIVKSQQPRKPNYDQLHKACGGMLQNVMHFREIVLGYEQDGVVYKKTYSNGTAWCNEEGKMHGLARNPRATILWWTACPGGSREKMTLVGDVIFYCNSKFVKSEPDRATVG